MKKYSLLFIIGLFLNIQFLWSATSIKKINSIGDDRKDYTFFKITGALIGQNKNIYVADSGGFFVAVYNWNGVFLNRIGRFGQGPQEFQFLNDIKMFQEKIYINDMNNRRIGVMDSKLSQIRFIPTRKLHLRGSFEVLDENRFMCSLADINNTGGKGQVVVFNNEGNVQACFFNQDQTGNVRQQSKGKEWAINQLTSKIHAATSYNKEAIAIVFEYPPNPVPFFIYSINGKEIKKSYLHLQNEYRFAEHLTHYPIIAPRKGAFYPIIRNLFSLRDGYCLHLMYKYSVGNDEKVEKAALIKLDSHGNKIAEISVDPDLLIFQIDDEGFMIGTHIEADEPQVSVYSISITP